MEVLASFKSLNCLVSGKLFSAKCCWKEQICEEFRRWYILITKVETTPTSSNMLNFDKGTVQRNAGTCKLCSKQVWRPGCRIGKERLEKRLTLRGGISSRISHLIRSQIWWCFGKPWISPSVRERWRALQKHI